MTDVEITATLTDAYWAEGGRCISGVILEDGKGRFPTGTRVRTSLIVEEIEPGVFKTLNSVYKVEFLTDELAKRPK